MLWSCSLLVAPTVVERTSRAIPYFGRFEEWLRRGAPLFQLTFQSTLEGSVFDSGDKEVQGAESQSHMSVKQENEFHFMTASPAPSSPPLHSLQSLGGWCGRQREREREESKGYIKAAPWTVQTSLDR
ncbi:hypothetical protein EYF80_027285 [Liparis tanakae]|uniref:Uncharacterized protein n=1 Tax=Liparis tanakae TaxID=230148 RepID=A0A4Z2HCI3_9TELE|nr:hypothetical protein EYF80_027285 [Liparis tanakae]